MDGDMKSETLTLMLAGICFCGCAGRMDADLLQARIREQASQLSDSQREVTQTKSELKRVRLEAERLRSELDLAKSGAEFPDSATAQVSKLRIYKLASGGINKDDQPGDDAVVVQFSPLDPDNEPVRVPGNVEITLLDPLLPESERELGKWSFSIDECRNCWTRGITSSGFQFKLPLDQPPQHPDIIVYLKFRTADDQRSDMSQVVKVAVPDVMPASFARRARPQPIKVVDAFDDDLPPVGGKDRDSAGVEPDDWDDEPAKTLPKNSHPVLHSSSWTDATIPVLR